MTPSWRNVPASLPQPCRVVSELVKQRLKSGTELFFWRNNIGQEVAIAMEPAGTFRPSRSSLAAPSLPIGLKACANGPRCPAQALPSMSIFGSLGAMSAMAAPYCAGEFSLGAIDNG